jgi:hypothetical protein
MKKLIINADDFGLTKGINKGVIKGIKEGIVSSTTVMINMPYAYEGIEILKSMGFKSAGVHLTLTAGSPTLPIDEIPSLVNNEGKFYKRRNELFPKLLLEDAEKELRNQIELFIKAGLKPSHLDGHHHIQMYDGLREIVAKLAKEFNLPVRYANEETKKYLKQNNIITTDGFSMEFYGDKACIDTIKENLMNFNGETFEFMCHPAFVDEELMGLSSYNSYRGKELFILTNKDLMNWIKSNGFDLIGFNGL